MPKYQHSHGVKPTVLLRKFTVFTLPVSATLFLVHLFGTKCAFPGLGVLPATGSFWLGLHLLYHNKLTALGSGRIGALSPGKVCFADTLLALVYVGMLVPTFVLLNRVHLRSYVALGAYASLFLIVNL